MKVLVSFILGCCISWSIHGLVLDGQHSHCLVPQCDCSQLHVLNCHSKGFVDIPSFHTTHGRIGLMTLDFSLNNLTSIRDNAFHSLSHAVRIRMNFADNRISSIGSHAFNGVNDKIIDLNLKDNLLKTLPVSVTQLQHMKTLSITNNPILNFHSARLQTMSRVLNEFAFGHANITQWPTEIDQLHHLYTLHVQGAKITSIPSTAFTHSSISDLTLNDTDLYDFPVAICNLRHLHRLEISSNKNHASEIGLFTPCQHRLYSVTELVLDNDDFYQTPTDIFGTFPNLRTLRIRGSKLLSNLDDLVVPSDCPLQTLDLTGNNLAAIPDVVTHMHSLKTVDVSNNPIICSCFMSWMKTWSRRDDVDLVGVCSGGEQIGHYVNNSLLKFC